MASSGRSGVPLYDWKRFWCPRGGTFSLSDGGYLADPESEWGYLAQPNVVPFEKIADAPCLVLLGEPGLGKTTAMEMHYASSAEVARKSGAATQWVPLGAYQTDVGLGNAIFGAATFQDWLKGTHRLHLFLDSLDECALRIDNVAAFLIEEFRKCPLDRLALRIACRTADWPDGLERGSNDLWGKDAVSAYELVPLRRADVQQAALANRLDAEAFLNEIRQKQVESLAIKPVTLNFLLNKYRKDHQLPSRQAELYREGCRLLCEETSQSRQDAGQIGDLTAEQRLATAARIAAVMTFCRRFAVWPGIDLGNVRAEDVTRKELSGGSESAEGEHFTVAEATVKEALDTGLFSSRGPGRLGWAHQTYAEFLAAHYLIKRELAIKIR